MFEVKNGIAKIDGKNGIYKEENIMNSSVRYGRNSVQNFYDYNEKPLMSDNNAIPPILNMSLSQQTAEKDIQQMQEYIDENDKYLKSLPPLQYEYRYMPNIHKSGEIDKDALLGAAYEQMGKRKDVSIKELDDVFAIDENYSAEPIDINNDGKIDIGEYSTTILAADMMSNPNNNIDGVINNKGHNAIQELTKKSNALAATQLYSSIYEKYDLGNAAKKFNS